MGTAYAEVEGERIVVQTRTTRHGDFDLLLAACKRVGGGRFAKEPAPHWHYPLSIDTCVALRQAFGDQLKVGVALAAWYRVQHAAAQQHTALSAARDATLPSLVTSHPDFVQWLRPSQRVGALWIAAGYRGAGLVGDTPGVGKTGETIAGIVESGITGPVLVICPKASVRVVWGKELRQHVPDVPVYLCHGTRAQRQKVLDQFAADMQENSDALRFVVIVAEMLRVELGDPCYTVQEIIGKDGLRRENVPHNKISGMCPQRMKNADGQCGLHVQVPAEKDKDKVPVNFSYRQLFDRTRLGGGWAHVVIDESHKLLGSLTVVKGNLMGRGLRYLPERPTHRRYALSGTPFGKAGRVQGLFGTLNWLWPDEYTSFWRWAGEKFEVTTKVVNRRGLEIKEIGPLKGLRPDATPDQQSEAWEAFLRELGPRLLRRTKAEAFKDLPPKQYAEEICEMTPAQAKQYRQLLLDAEVSTPGGPIMANGSLALLTRSRQIANGPIIRTHDGGVTFTNDSGKIERLVDALEARGIVDGLPGEKLLVVSAFNEFLDAIARHLDSLNVSFARYDGRMSQNTRDATVNAWQESPIDTTRVLLLNLKAGGLSITLDMADEVHMMDEDPDPGVNEQVEDRAHRASRVHHVLVTYYRTPGTIDFKRAHEVEFRRRVQHALLDGRRGVADTRAALTEAFADYQEDQ